jgi:hypothetical protein
MNYEVYETRGAFTVMIQERQLLGAEWSMDQIHQISISDLSNKSVRWVS